ncbi:aspartic proteinase 36 isoform X2 [Capsicum annuum]|uniref:aspartic proteinase 36 isoform X2 n=1 Tax=Capsicum annuum TaxID=4072 RepID=UPI001FB04FF9|nr:aspartic proteinase 36 isoform X2 [Capsicum annuum]
MDLRRKGCLILLLVSVLEVAVKGNNNVVFNVKHRYGGRGGSILNELRAHDSHRHGRMLAAVDFPLGGNGQPTDAALYYTKLTIGTPSKDYHVQVDTGSDILWVNCAGCARCPSKSSLGIDLMLYDLKASATGKTVSCDQDFCTAMFNAPYSECRVGSACEYQVTYGDGSSTSGYFVKDYIHFDQVSGDLQTTSINGSIAFGCSSSQSGELGSSTQAVDGIIGFGQANSSLISQLAVSGKVKKVFSHCLDGSNGGGIFAIGQVVQPKVKSTPLVPNEPHYNVVMKGIEVNGEPLNIPTTIFDAGSNRGTIIDSGTTLAYLPNKVYNALMSKLMVRQPDLTTHLVDESFHCFFFSGKIDDGFPVVTFQFADSLSLKVYPHDYLFQVSDNEWCIGWQDSGMQTKDGKEITLLGGSSSIKVRDGTSGKVYTVGSHNISSASTLNSRMFFTFFVLVISILCNLLK